ncbi:UBC core domain-containing protein [Abortiporus biennis]
MQAILGLSPSPTIDLSTPNRKNSRATSRLPSTNSPALAATTDSTPTALTRTAVSLEYASLRHNGHCPLGMYVIPTKDNLLVWDGVFFVHQGYYQDSILKFRLTFPPNYPERPPVVQFLTDVFHPLISQQDGIFNLAPRFRPWKPKEHHIFDVLHWVKAAFKKHALDEIKDVDCLNKEAFRYVFFFILYFVDPFILILQTFFIDYTTTQPPPSQLSQLNHQCSPNPHQHFSTEIILQWQEKDHMILLSRN